MAGGESSISVGDRPDKDQPGERTSSEPRKPNPASRTLGDNSDDLPGRATGQRGQAEGAGQAPVSRETPYGNEGTNKTMPHPKPDSAPSEDLGGKQTHIPNSPHTRG